MPTARERVSALVDSVISLGQKTGEEVFITVTKTVDDGYTFVIEEQILPNTNKAELFVEGLHEAIGEEVDKEVAKEISRRERRVLSLKESIASLQAAIDAEEGKIKETRNG